MKPLSVSIAVALLFVARSAIAQENADDNRFQIDAGADLVWGPLSEVCEKNYDLITCVSGGTGMPSAHIGAQFRKPKFAIGPFGAIGRLENSEATEAFMWRAGLELKLYAHAGEVLDFWLGLELEWAGAHADIKKWSLDPDAAPEEESRFGPGFGLGMGWDFKITPAFALGYSFRALWLHFIKKEDDDFDTLLLNSAPWIGVGVNGRFTFPGGAGGGA